MRAVLCHIKAGQLSDFRGFEMIVVVCAHSNLFAVTDIVISLLKLSLIIIETAEVVEII